MTLRRHTRSPSSDVTGLHLRPINSALGGLNPLAANALPAADSQAVTVATDPGASECNNVAPTTAPIVVETGGDPKADEESQDAEDDQEDKPTKPEKKPSGSTSMTKAAGPSASPEPT